MEQFIYRTMTREDIPQLKKLWYTYPGQPLGAWYQRMFDEWCENNRMQVVTTNEGQVVAFAAYQIKPRKREIELKHILVSREYRGRGLSKDMIHHMYNITKGYTDQGWPLVISCVEGLENNTYYDKFGQIYDRKKVKKEGREWIIYYKLDIDKIKQWGPDKFN